MVSLLEIFGVTQTFTHTQKIKHYVNNEPSVIQLLKHTHPPSLTKAGLFFLIQTGHGAPWHQVAAGRHILG